MPARVYSKLAFFSLLFGFYSTEVVFEERVVDEFVDSPVLG